MKSPILPICLIAAAAIGFAACDEDSTTTVGSALAGSNVEIIIDSAFTIEGHTVPVEAIVPKTTQQLIGKINIDNYGTLSSDVVCQFLPATELDTTDFSYKNVDSLFLTLRYSSGAYIGDSLTPMAVSIYPLTKQLPKDISSNFNPTGYYSPASIGSKVYNTGWSFQDTVYTSSGNQAAYGQIDIKLPTELGRTIFKDFQDNPANFANGKVFSENVFPGVFMKTTYGSGRMTLVTTSMLTFHLRNIVQGEEKLDTLDAVHQYMLVTPEVLNNNNLTYEMSDYLKQQYSDGKQLLVAPAALEVEFTMPAEKLMDEFRTQTQGRGVLNSLTLSLPVDSIANTGQVSPPPYVLMVLKKERDEFFAKNRLTDNVSSFYATYNSTDHTYVFTGLRGYLLDLLSKDEITAEDYTFSLVPVQVNFEEMVSSGYYTTPQYTESEILPYLISPAMCELRLSDAKLKLTFSLQKGR